MAANLMQSKFETYLLDEVEMQEHLPLEMEEIQVELDVQQYPEGFFSEL